MWCKEVLWVAELKRFGRLAATCTCIVLAPSTVVYMAFERHNLCVSLLFIFSWTIHLLMFLNE